MLQYHKKRPRSEESILKIMNCLWSMAMKESFGKVMKSIKAVESLRYNKKHLWRRVSKNYLGWRALEYSKNIYGGEFWKSYEKYLGWEPLPYHKIVKTWIITKWTKIITKWGKFWLLQSGMTSIIKWDGLYHYKVGQFYYKVGQFYFKVVRLLQSEPIITKRSLTQNLLLQSNFPIKVYQPEEDPTVVQTSDKDCSMLFMFSR